jgi:hypothetical protein
MEVSDGQLHSVATLPPLKSSYTPRADTWMYPRYDLNTVVAAKKKNMQNFQDTTLVGGSILPVKKFTWQPCWYWEL